MIPFVKEDGTCYFNYRIANTEEAEILAENNNVYLLKIGNRKIEMNKKKAKLVFYGAEKLN